MIRFRKARCTSAIAVLISLAVSAVACAQGPRTTALDAYLVQVDRLASRGNLLAQMAGSTAPIAPGIRTENDDHEERKIADLRFALSVTERKKAISIVREMKANASSKRTPHDVTGVSPAFARVSNAVELAKSVYDREIALLSILPYDVDAALAYAKKWCKTGNDCKDGQIKPFWSRFQGYGWSGTDCTHFVAHILDAGGITISGSPQCASGLTIRVSELLDWFVDASKTFSNVTEVGMSVAPRAGDYCFQLNPDGTPKHIMLLAKNPRVQFRDDTDEVLAEVYGHQNNRCGDETVVIEKMVPNLSARYFRITPTDNRRRN